MRGIDEQIAKAQRAVDGTAAVKRNRYIKQSGATKVSGEFGLDAHHQLWRIEKGFRMSEHELQARPIYHHKRESIEAHLSIVFAALAVSRWIEYQTGWNIKEIRPIHTPLPHRANPRRAHEALATISTPSGGAH